MIGKRIYDILETCIQELGAGTSIDDTLVLYPGFQSELRPLLVTAQAARDYAANIQVPKGAQELNRAHLLIAARERINQKTGFLGSFALPRLAFALVILLVVLTVSGVTTATASSKALPGDLLYPIKLATERTRLLLTNNPVQRLELQETYDQERVEEIQELYQKYNAVEVNLGGPISKIAPEEFQVQNIRVYVTQDTQVAQNLEDGLYVDIKGVLEADGGIKATSIQPRQIEVNGVLRAVSTNKWVIDDIPLQFTADSKIKGSLNSGRQAEVKAYLMADGSLQVLEINIKGKPDDDKGDASTRPGLKATNTPAAEEEENKGSEKGQGNENKGSGQEITKTPKPTRPPDEKKLVQPTATDQPEEYHAPSDTSVPGDNYESEESPETSQTPEP